MALISIHIGKKIGITTTIRRSTGSLFPDLFVSQPSRKSLTLKDVILCHCRWLRLNMYQQANNHWLWKLAHGREIYLIPTGDIAAVVFTTQLLTQLRNRGIDLDRVSHLRARQDGKLLDKTANTKYAAQQIAEQIQGWLRARATDQTPNMRSPSSAINWLSFASARLKTTQRALYTSQTGSIQFKSRCNPHPTCTHERWSSL